MGDEEPVQLLIELQETPGILGRTVIHALEVDEVVGKLEFERTAPGEITVWSVQVAPELRRQGIGTRMVELMVGLHRDTTRLRLHQVLGDGPVFWARVAADRGLAVEHSTPPLPQV